jgi:hypothetical protein
MAGRGLDLLYGMIRSTGISFAELVDEQGLAIQLRRTGEVIYLPDPDAREMPGLALNRVATSAVERHRR